jgi:PAS domain S-box-containing protein
LTRTNNDSNFYLSDYSQSLAFLLDDDLEQDSLIISDLDFSEKIDHHILNTTGFIKIFSIIDFNEAYDDQGSFLLRQPISIFLLNISLLLGVTFILVILKSKNDDKILLNANMYLSDKNNDGVLITNNKEEITYVNEAFESGFGFKAKEVIGNKPSDVLGRLNFNIEERLKLNEYVFSDHIWNRTKSGIYLLKYLRIRPEIALNNKLKHFIAIYSRPQFSLETLSLSSLSNIKTTLKVLISGFDDLIFIENSSCFIVIKTSNELENFGWKGNLFDASEKLKLPIFLAENLNDIYRIAVPENGYIILFTNLIENDKNLETQINVITDLIDKYKHLSASRINLKYDIGVAVTTDDVNNKEDLLYNSLIALEKTKNLRNVKHTIYDLNIKKRMDRDKDIFEQLENAFAKDEFYLKYQPQFDLTTHDLIGVEALLRWKNEKLGEIMPNDFIPIIENSYFVNQLTKTVLSKVINDFSSIFSKMSKEFRVSINLTFFDFSEEYLLINLVKVIKDSTMKTENFCFEITESGYLENVEKTNHIIDFLHKNGVIVALDDFGTGYSSLSFLRNLKVDQVKIDRSFIKDYPSEDKGMMFKALATLLNNMGFSIVVEGVETYDHLILAQQSKCNKVQGYYFSKPIVISEFIKNYIKK